MVSLFKILTKQLKPIAPLLISIAILSLIYSKIDIDKLRSAIIDANILILAISLSISIILGLVVGLRYFKFSYRLNIRPFPKYITSVKSYFLASCLNLFLPSKIGDLSKGLICQRIDSLIYPTELHIFTLYEKLSDLFALIIIGIVVGVCKISFIENDNFDKFIKYTNILNIQTVLTLIFLFAFIFLFLILAPYERLFLTSKIANILPKKLKDILSYANRFSWKEFAYFHGSSIIIWFIHLLQMVIFAYSLGMNLWNLSGLFVLISSVLIGLLPISLAGVGTRDASLVFFLSSLHGPEKPLLLGVLLTSRYIIPSIMGLLFIKDLRVRA